MENIKIVFDRLYKEPFPAENGKEIEGINLNLLDADTMGLVSSFLHTKGNLSKTEIEILTSCISDLALITPHLAVVEKKYFDSLKDLANSVFELCKR